MTRWISDGWWHPSLLPPSLFSAVGAPKTRKQRRKIQNGNLALLEASPRHFAVSSKGLSIPSTESDWQGDLTWMLLMGEHPPPQLWPGIMLVQGAQGRSHGMYSTVPWQKEMTLGLRNNVTVAAAFPSTPAPATSLYLMIGLPSFCLIPAQDQKKKKRKGKKRMLAVDKSLATVITIPMGFNFSLCLWNTRGRMNLHYPC